MAELQEILSMGQSTHFDAPIAAQAGGAGRGPALGKEHPLPAAGASGAGI